MTVLLNRVAGSASTVSSPGASISTRSRVTARTPPSLDDVRATFAAAGLPVQVYAADGATLAAIARRTVAARPAVIVAGGGDGTISTLAHVVAGSETALGVLPLGTLNHFARDLGIPLDLTGAVQTIVAGHATRVDIGEVNGRTFINNASLGLYPSLVYQREKRQERGHRKWIAMALAAMQMWRRYRRVRVALHPGGQSIEDRDGRGGAAGAFDADVRIVRTPFVVVGNNQYALTPAGFGTRARLDAGTLHVAMAPGMTRAQMLAALALALRGRFSADDHLDTLCVPELTIAASRRSLRVALDGETTRLATPLHFRIRPGALRVCVPATASTATTCAAGAADAERRGGA